MKNNVGKIDPYFIGYNILTKSLNEPEFYDGVSKALFLAKIFTSSTDAILYKRKKDGIYYHFNNSSVLSHNIDYITKIVNNKNINYDGEFHKLDNGQVNKLIMIPIVGDIHEYSLVLANPIIEDSDLNTLMDVLKKTFNIILSKMDMYRDIKKIAEKDALTGMTNRLVYNNIIEYLNNNNIPFSFAILDLFRLKYVNDNFGYACGDMYIKESAEIIKSFFPKYKSVADSKGNLKRIQTGDYVFRIGGDEFAVISTSKDKDELLSIISYLANEVDISLPLDEEVLLKINYGISERNGNENPEEVFKRANIELSENKRIMYQMNNIERRR